jgi:hypothetical protein
MGRTRVYVTGDHVLPCDLPQAFGSEPEILDVVKRNPGALGT